MEIAIVGAGPVGILFANLLLNNGHQVTLVESGNLHEESELLSIRNYLFESPSSLPNGVHKIGGGSTLWRARISEFQDTDFKFPGSVESGSWPFSKKELEHHYAKLYNLLGAGDLTDNEFLEKYFGKEIKQLPQDFEMRLFRFCEPDFFVNLFDQIKDNPNLKLLSGHLCKSIEKLDINNRLQLELLPKSWNVKTYSFDSVVIACGTLQTTALLQRSISLIGADTFENLGKFLMEHIEGYIGKAWTFGREERKFFSAIGLNNENRSIDAFHGAGVGLSLKHMNNIGDAEINTHFEFRAPMPKFYFPKFKENFRDKNSVFITLLDLAIFLERTVSFVLRRARAALLQILHLKMYSIYLKAEEIPFSNSTTSLPEQDENFLVYKHEISEITWQRLNSSILEFEHKFNLRFKARIKFFKKARSSRGLKSLFGPNWHPMGTTRMGSDPKHSVVDGNLAIHGTPNCYVLSASVFPTGSNSNPTFTTLALASRLSESIFFSKSQ